MKTFKRPVRSLRGSTPTTESGMTLILVLGFLCVMMMVMLTLALASRTERKAAAVNADLIRARMLAESAVEQAAGRLAVEFDQANLPGPVNLYPGNLFIRPASGSAWAGRAYLSTGSATPDTVGIREALAVDFGGLSFTPSAELTSTTGWVPVKSTRWYETQNKEVQTGRYAYVIIDESGKVDPSGIVSTRRDEAAGQAKTGEGQDEIDLGDMGVADPDRFRPQDVHEGTAGTMPDEGRWFSAKHLVKQTGLTTEADMAQVRRKMHPFSYDREVFWRDANGNAQWDEGEDVDRLNILAARSYDIDVLYPTFVGADATAHGDDVEWLKRQCAAGFGKTMQTGSTPASAAGAARRIAAQTAVNMKDYADPDPDRTIAHIDGTGALVECDHVNSPNACVNMVHVKGAEKRWNISAVAMRVGVEEISEVVREWERSISINPNVAESQEFKIAACPKGILPATESDITAYGTVPSNPLIEASEEPDGSYTFDSVDNLHGYELKPYDLDGDGQITGTLETNVPHLEYNNSLYPMTYEPNNGSLKTWVIDPAFIKAKYDVTIDSDFDYDGYAWYVQFKCKADGRDFDLDGLYNDLATSTCWKISKYVDPLDPTTDRIPVHVYFHSLHDINASGSMGQWWIGFPDMDFSLNDVPANGGYRFLPAFKVQAHYPWKPGPNQNQIPFSVGNSSITPSEDCIPVVTVLGAEASVESGAHDIPITVGLGWGSGTDKYPWGQVTGTDTPLAASVNDRLNPRQSTAPARNAGESISFDVTAWEKGATAWEADLTAAGVKTSSKVKVLVNGDEFPSADPGEHLRDFVVGGKVVLEANQALFVYEVGDPAGTNYTDLGVLVTLKRPDDPTLPYPPCSHAMVNYTITIATFEGDVQTYTDTCKVPLDASKNIDGGLLKWTSFYKEAEWGRVYPGKNKTLDLYKILDARINSIELIEDTVNFAVIDRVPQNPADTLCGWEQGPNATGNEWVNDPAAAYYAYLQAWDAMENTAIEADPEFEDYWMVKPDVTYLSKNVDPSVGRIGSIISKDGSTDKGLYSIAYGDSDVANSVPQRLGELGRVHSYYPMRSLRLWSGPSETGIWNADGSATGHDAALIDLFKVGGYTEKRGKVNPNSLQADVLNGLFAGTDVNLTAGTPASVILGVRQSTTFSSLGQVFGDVPGLYEGFATNEDDLAEEIAVDLAERLTVRQNYFTVIACAQTFQDVGGVSYSGGTASLGKLDPYTDGAGNTRYVDPLLAEQKVMAVVYRDAYSKKTKICSIQYLND